MHKSASHPERRSVERFFVSLPVETDKGPGKTRDMSVSGLYLVVDHPLAVGEQLRLTLTLPDPDQPVPLKLSLKGTVVRVEEANGATGAGIALDEENSYLRLAS